MNQQIQNAFNALDDDIVEEFVQEDMKRTAAILPNRKKLFRKYLSVAAACLVIAIGISVLYPMLTKDPKQADPALSGNVALFNQLEDTTRFSSQSDYQSGSQISSSGGSAAPLPDSYYDDMYIKNLSIVAKATEVLPDVYSFPEVGIRYLHSNAYKVIKLSVIDSIHAANVPNEIYYLLPAEMDADLTQYQHLILILLQVGEENTVLVNQDQNKYEAFSFVFTCPYEQYKKGSILAFNDNQLDQSLWQKKGWKYGGPRTPAYYGCTMDYTVDSIRELNQNYEARSVNQTSTFTSEEAKEALSYVHPFDHGVFIQRTVATPGVIYYRMINRFHTNESISIASDGTVTQTGERFTNEDLTKLPDIESLIETLDLENITPPHTARLSELTVKKPSVVGKYCKYSGTVYGIIRLTWVMSVKADSDQLVYDDLYILAKTDGSYQIVERDELREYIGRDQILTTFDYGKVYWQDRVNV